ncbi:deoxyribose-phosphate aldolase [Tamlana fucoidanivorans]|uniref:Deoxyribose-phosphate aldolase n=1 Tax=Allotamlana fucoidanivorans TaxID=2583814 RepID=A0A5C4SHQ5_9FLAO|nr:deoxyribose-phosphate aldolase [Tamlana fucoidanivorans]TNJ42970.1 deoxyribose-phosphate aldolase [Tamlana fucoidanivorans]
MNLSKQIDLTLLHATTTERDIINLAQEAIKYNFHSICVSSCYVPLAKQLITDSDIKISTVVGFPLGAATTSTKIFEAKEAIDYGADEISMVVNLGLLKSRNYVSILKDITDVKLAIGNIPLKVIIEISELNKNEIIKVCEICLDAKADYIETSTGFSKGGATLTAVKIIKKTVRDNISIKATGDIDDLETILKYLENGADRVGISTIIKPINNLRQLRNNKVYKQYLENSTLLEVEKVYQ